MNPSTYSHTNGMHVLIQLKDTDTFLFILRSDYKERNALHRDIIWWWLQYGEHFEEWIYREMKEETWIIPTQEEKKSLHIIWTYQKRRNKEKTRRWSAVIYHIVIENKDIELSHEHTEYKRLTLEQITQLTPKRKLIESVLRMIKGKFS